MTNDQVPDFCLFVNTASKTSAIWTKADGWMECKPEEFEAILVVQQLVRNSDHPETTLMQIKNAKVNLNCYISKSKQRTFF